MPVRPPGRPPAARRRPVAAIAALALGAAAAAGAARANEADPVRSFVESRLPQGLGRVEITVGSLDPRLQLAPCRRIEPYLLPGTRLWGRTAIGVRCVDGATWTVALPLTVSVRGRAVVAAEPIAAGRDPSGAALRIEEIELTAEPGTPVTDPAQLAGRTLVRAVPAGHVLRVEHLRIAPTVTAGDPVKIRMIGQGFAIQADGQVLGAAAEGQTVRVRTEAGRVLAGTLRGRTVEVRI